MVTHPDSRHERHPTEVSDARRYAALLDLTPDDPAATAQAAAVQTVIPQARQAARFHRLLIHRIVGRFVADPRADPISGPRIQQVLELGPPAWVTDPAPQLCVLMDWFGLSVEGCGVRQPVGGGLWRFGGGHHGRRSYRM